MAIRNNAAGPGRRSAGEGRAGLRTAGLGQVLSPPFCSCSFTHPVHPGAFAFVPLTCTSLQASPSLPSCSPSGRDIFKADTGSVPAVLGRPTLSVQHTPEGSLLARWEPPASGGNDEVLGYRLQFGREDSMPLATLEFPATEDHYAAAGVHKGATYVFRLAARSRVGLGEEATEVLSVPEDAPRGHPHILEAAGNASAGTVLLRWLPPVPAERNGAIVKYTVAVREAGALGPARETELPAAAEPGAENALTLQGLKPDTAYDLQVRAHTRRGPGPYSPPVRYRTFLRDQGRQAHGDPHSRRASARPPFPPPPAQVSGHFSASMMLRRVWTPRRPCWHRWDVPRWHRRHSTLIPSIAASCFSLQPRRLYSRDLG